MQAFDIIIIGAGAMGSAAAYYAAKAGQRVLLLEQFEIDHQKGSSYGLSRIIRYAYDHPAYIRMAKRVYPMWAALEEESGEKLYIRTGGIDFAVLEDAPSLRDTIASLQAENIQHEILAPQEAEQRFPHFRFDDNMTVLYQDDTGMLPASKCVQTHIRLAQKYGADVCDNKPVTRINIHTDSVDVYTVNDRYSAAKLIISAGSWTNNLLDFKLPLQTLKCHEIYFQPGRPMDHMPVFIAHSSSFVGDTFYGIPSVNGSGVKASIHGGPPVEHPIDYTPDTSIIENVRGFLRQHIPSLGYAPMISMRVCLYTMTPDTHFIIDYHPAHRHVVIASPCSGHGFKFSTFIGSMLVDMALHGRTDQDISLFSINRFS
jgi:monomeric sarcosine oxidase